MKRALTALLLSASISLLAPFLVSAMAGCGGGQDTSVEQIKKAEKEDSENEVDAKGKKWGGWRWKGKRNDCFFVHNNECFSKLAKACKKAKCPKDKCGHDDGAPATVECK